jgi:putative ABC transport system permease protein
METLQTLKTALNSLRLNRVRTFLTMLGVIIGVFSVIILVSIVRGVENYITDQFSALGSNLVFISPGKVSLQGDPTKSLAGNKLDYKHVEMIDNYLKDQLVGVTPWIELYQNASFKTKNYNAALTGISDKGLEIFDLKLATGRMYTNNEESTKAKVAVIGYDVADKLFGSQKAVGQKIKLGTETFEVIGVMEKKSQAYDNIVFAPDTTVKQTYNIKKISSIVLKTKNGVDAENLKRDVELTLRRDLEKDDFTVMTQKDMLKTIQSVISLLSTILAAIAGISLVVGGIGIMNIMLVAVTERTQEIGLRKALGATPTNIALQFTFEAVVISIAGGLIGLLFGFLASLIARFWINAEVPLWAIALSIGFSLVVGIIFGTYPAIKAARKDPIEALRYE